MRISTIICTRSNERLRDLWEAVVSVHEQTFREHEIVIVVDNNDGLAVAVRRYVAGPVRVVELRERSGLAAARNRGVEVSKGEIIAFLDDDAVASRDWLARLAAHYVDQDVMAVGGRTIPLWLAPPPRWLPEELHWVVGCTYREYGRNGKVRNLMGNCMSFRRDVFCRIGGFLPNLGHNQNLLGGEETEFCLRLKAHFPDARIVFDPEAVVFHKVPPFRCTLGYLLRRSYAEGRSKAIIRALVREVAGPLSDERQYLLALMTQWAPTMGWRLLTGDLRRGLAEVAGVSLALAAAVCGYVGERFRTWFRRKQVTERPLMPLRMGAVVGRGWGLSPPPGSTEQCGRLEGTGD